ncbi:hypothetical protein R1X32_01080 (plasmid) [Rhodococcus opacus]|uniref:hypothetical protein n=1 Tax=Rhodococcus opacus TaxID=37919 RepID=UPI0034D2BCF1
MMKQESASLTRALTRHAKFEHLPGMRPQEDYAVEVERRADALPGNRPQGEEKMLEQMATIIGKAVNIGYPELEPGIESEAVASIWHRYSGVAHGYAWPEQVDVGDFITDFGMVVPVAHTAFDLALKRSKAPER